MHLALKSAAMFAWFAVLASAARASEPSPAVTEGKQSLTAAGKYLEVEVSLTRPQLLRLMVDSLGQRRFQPSPLRAPLVVPPSGGASGRSPAQAGTTSRPAVAHRIGAKVEYRRQGLAPTTPARWTFEFGPQGMVWVSQWSADDPPEPLVLDFDPDQCHATLLGLAAADGSIRLPALLHLPDQGTFRISSGPSAACGAGVSPAGAAGTPAGAAETAAPQGEEKATTGEVVLGYSTCRNHGIGDSAVPCVKVTFPPATRAAPRLEYRWEVTAIYPHLANIENDARFDGFRRNWLNIFQINPRYRALANNAASDVCAICLYEYADVALHTPPAAGPPSMLDLIRQSLERYLEGMTAYGLPGYYGDQVPPPAAPKRDPFFMDTYPSLLIAAADYVIGSNDDAWLKANYEGIRKWADLLLTRGRDGNGLLVDPVSGNSGSWTQPPTNRSSNWWDVVGFGHEDAYANALAYRALRNMEELAGRLGKSEDAARFHTAADKLHEAYFKTFYNPATGVLAGWRSADGQLHDYYFPFISGIAIHYGLVPKDHANAVMDKLLAKMKEVGYARFDLGLPGNLVPISPGDYLGLRENRGAGPNGFQRYANGGATACFAYFTLAALYDLGRRQQADQMLFPMLESFAKGAFQGRGPDDFMYDWKDWQGRHYCDGKLYDYRWSYDWKDWQGRPWGYEGLLVDNYYTLLAVLAREGRVRPVP